MLARSPWVAPGQKSGRGVCRSAGWLLRVHLHLQHLPATAARCAASWSCSSRRLAAGWVAAAVHAKNKYQARTQLSDAGPLGLGTQDGAAICTRAATPSG